MNERYNNLILTKLGYYVSQNDEHRITWKSAGSDIDFVRRRRRLSLQSYYTHEEIKGILEYATILGWTSRKRIKSMCKAGFKNPVRTNQRIHFIGDEGSIGINPATQISDMRGSFTIEQLIALDAFLDDIDKVVWVSRR